MNCANCGKDLSGNFCSGCGQSAHTHRVDLKHILHEFMHGILHVDKGIIFTAKELMIRPGTTVRNYLEGKRVNYFKPFGYFFILATIYTFLMHFLEVPILDMKVHVHGEADAGSQLPASIEAFNRIYLQVVHFVNEKYAVATLLTMPILTLFSYLIFYRAKLNYGEHLVINLYVSGQLLLISILLIPVSYYFPSFASVFIFLLLMAVKGYLFYSIFNQYKLYARVLLSICISSVDFIMGILVAIIILITLISLS